MPQLVLIIHVLVSICLIALVLLQQGRGAAVGASFGSGASQTLFGSRGTTSFLFKLTAGFATIFFITSLTLAYLASHRAAEQSQILMPTSAESSTLESLDVPKEPEPQQSVNTPAPVANPPIENKTVNKKDGAKHR